MARRTPLRSLSVLSVNLAAALVATLVAGAGAPTHAASRTAAAPADHPPGSVVGWGYDGDDQATPPDEVAALTDLVDVAAGHNHSVAVRADGSVLTWGGDRETHLLPDGLDDAVAVSAGSYWSATLRDDGTVVDWGNNEWDQLSVPEDLSDVVAIDVDGSHGLALRADGSVVIWGGDTPAGRPTLPPGLSDVVAVSASSHDLFLLADGTVVASGDDTWGETVPPEDLDDAVAVSAGGGFSLALVSADAEPPVVTVPGGVEAEATSPRGARVEWTATAHDETDGDLPVTCSPESGSRLPLGPTRVTCSATDAAGNTGTDSFVVTVAYAWSGFLSPVRDQMVLRAHRPGGLLGRVVPVRFRLTGASAGVRGVEATLWVARVRDGEVGERRPARAWQLAPHRWNRTYLWLWSTRGLRPGRYVLGVDLGDGAERTVRFRVRRR